MNVTLAQTSPSLNRSNFDEIVRIIDAHKSSSDLIVFSELSLSGYALQDKLDEDAWSIDDLSELCELSKEIDIVVGLALKEGDFFRNSAIYFSEGKLLHQHNKVHLPNYGMFEEARYFKAGSGFECFESSFGKTSMLICEDMWKKEVHSYLREESPDLIIVIVASPARGFCDDGLSIEQEWQKLLKLISKEADSKLIFLNRVGFEDGLGFWGGSCVLNENAEIIKKLQHYNVTVEQVDI